MRKYIIMLIVSIILIILSVASIWNKIAIPNRKNKLYSEYLDSNTEDFWKNVDDNAEKRKQEEEKAKSNEKIKVELPKNDQEICRAVIGSYIHNINTKNYEKAYNMLDEKFKKTNFETIEKYIEYCSNTYKDYKVLQYVNYERRSDYLIVYVNVSSLNNETDIFPQQINIAENETGNYTLSFGIEG